MDLKGRMDERERKDGSSIHLFVCLMKHRKIDENNFFSLFGLLGMKEMMDDIYITFLLNYSLIKKYYSL